MRSHLPHSGKLADGATANGAGHFPAPASGGKRLATCSSGHLRQNSESFLSFSFLMISSMSEEVISSILVVSP